MNRNLLLVLHIISMVLLGFGLFLDMLHINISTHFIVDINLFNEKRSVIGSLQSLWQSDHYWPFLLIAFFGIIVPLLKSIIIFYLLLAKKPLIKWQVFVNVISKWAMADVFAIAIFIAFLGANAMENTTASMEPGFYYFSSYVLLSGLIALWIGKMLHHVEPNKA